MRSTFILVVSLFIFALVAYEAKIHPDKASPSDVFWGELNKRFDVTLFNNTNTKLNAVRRHEVMDRARSWTAKKIPYCQCNGPEECCGHCPHCGTFRCDCSGYVSYCWGLPYGYTTWTLPEVSHEITKHELKEGDVLLNVHDHVVIFGGWADRENKTYHCFQEPGCHTSGPHYAYESTVPYPFNYDASLFKPYRYKHIVD